MHWTALPPSHRAARVSQYVCARAAGWPGERNGGGSQNNHQNYNSINDRIFIFKGTQYLL